MEVGRKASGAVGCFTPLRTLRPSIAVGGKAQNPAAKHCSGKVNNPAAEHHDCSGKSQNPAAEHGNGKVRKSSGAVGWVYSRSVPSEATVRDS